MTRSRPDGVELAAHQEGRIAELDGLRGIAVLAVIASHYTFTRLAPVFSFGWAGVDLFFTLSGFLITTILRRTRNTPHYYRRFWTRRARRIWPLAYAVLLAYFVASWLLAPALAQDSTLWIVYVLFLQAIVPPVPTSPPLWMSHFIGIAWSLSVEEWFYVIWAPVVRLLTRNRLLAFCAALILIEPAVRAALHESDFPEYFLFVTRADSLAWGAVAALLLESPQVLERLREHARAIVWSAIALLVLVVLMTHNGDRSRLTTALFAYTFIDAAFTSILAVFVAGTTMWAARFCGAEWLRHVGTVSYGMYLFHMPMFDLTRFAFALDPLSTRVIAFAGTLGFASLS
jgi:peptidoglycan/LPS O-acetylase OafA/YrhL